MSSRSDRRTRSTGRVADLDNNVNVDAAETIPTPGNTLSGNPTSSYSTALRTLSSAPIPSLPSQASSSRQLSPKRRTRSPTKQVRTPADLHLAQTPVRPVTLQTMEQIPTSLRALFDGMKRIARGHSTIPRALVAEVTATLGPRDPDIEQAYLVDGEAYPVEDHWVLSEFEQLKRVVVLSEECSLDGASEVVWNESVHSRLLDIALAPRRGIVRYRNVTTVDICPDYLLPLGDAPTRLPDSTGVPAAGTSTGPLATLQTKRVDYVITLDDDEVRTLAEQLVREQVASGLGPGSINHVDNDFLRCRPIAVSIETKTPEGGELHGRTQLSIWGAAHIMRLRAAGAEDTTDGGLALPLVLVVGSRWTVYFLIDRGDCMVSVPPLHPPQI